MPRPHTIPRAVAVAALSALPFVASCVSSTPAQGNGPIAVTSTATECRLSATSAPSGTITFKVTNAGEDVTEFYLLAEDGVKVVGEVENVGPGLSRDLVVQARPGSYVTACKPGMAGEGIRAPFTVTDSGASVDPSQANTVEQLEEAEELYVDYVRSEVKALASATNAFAEAYRTGDDAAAREQYAPARVHWERIEPVAEAFGDLDALLDLREADLAAGDTWTGWHLIEKDLWPPDAKANGGTPYVPLTPAQRTAAARALVRDTDTLRQRVDMPDFSFEAFQIANGAQELLDEVATGKVTGEEEIWSHTDLWDFQANVEGAKQAFEVLEDVAEGKDPQLVVTLDERFDALEALLAKHGSLEEGFKPYTALSTDEVQALAAAVDALAQPLSKLTSTVAAGG